jgi:hypothetical protein
LIGLSLSLCIGDIVRGRIDEKSVTCIISGTCMETDEQWERVIERYSEVYWTDYDFRGDAVSHAEEARKVVDRMRKTGRIIQPRTMGQEPYNIASGHWINPDASGVKGYLPR